MATKKKKVVSKEELRRLMKEKKSSVATSAKKIEHPLAKYNSLDQLVCSMCNSVIKSNLLWPAHIQSKQHKERVDLMKTAGPAVDRGTLSASGATKRSGSSTWSQTVEKKMKGTENHNNNKPLLNSTSSGLPADFFDNGQQSTALKSAGHQSGLAAYSSSSEDEEETTATTKSSNALPSDFFDKGIAGSTQKTNESVPVTKPNTMAEALPEGFFDDPVMDAKVRQVEYKDKMEEEWELFQKAMKEESHVSEAIIEEEDEQVNVDRNIDEIDDQMNRWKEINDLAIKKQAVVEHSASKDTNSKSDSSEEMDDEELEEFMNWRSKKSWK